MDYDQSVVDSALAMLKAQIKEPELVINNPQSIQSYLQLKLAHYEQEVFAVAFLNNQHGLIEYKEMFFGSISSSAVHPREVVKAALSCNAAAVIFAHNHPSGKRDPSIADIEITIVLKEILQVVDIKVLDHFIVTTDNVYSFAENGRI